MCIAFVSSDQPVTGKIFLMKMLWFFINSQNNMKEEFSYRTLI